MESGEPHQRRPRYRGKNPRRFEEKYKEHDPNRYQETLAKVRARGKTPAGQHVPILVDEILATLKPAPGERAVDATLGFGGHAELLLHRLQPGGSLLGLDRDPLEIERTTKRLRALGFGEEALRTQCINFAGIGKALHEVGWQDGVDLVLVDLGVSSMQIDNPARGFSFKLEGPLDMRMNPQRGLSAREWLRRADAAKLERALTDGSDEPLAGSLAQALAGQDLNSTTQLAQAIRAALPRYLDEENAMLTVRRVFQALRIAVNEEFSALDAFLAQLPSVLRPAGRVAILTFHSGEDRRIKRHFKQGLADQLYAEISHDVVRASAAELHSHPRASSAKLRWAVRAG